MAYTGEKLKAFHKRTEKEREPIKKLSERHIEMCRQVAAGATRGEVARKLGACYDTVKRVTRSPVGMAKIAEIQEQLITRAANPRSRLHRAGEDAAKFIVGVVRGEETTDKALRFKASQDLLDRIGVSRTPNDDMAKAALIDLKTRLETVKALGKDALSRIQRDEDGVIIDITAAVEVAKETISAAVDRDGGHSGADGGLDGHGRGPGSAVGFLPEPVEYARDGELGAGDG